MGRPGELIRKSERPAEWLIRAIIIGLLSWASLTLLSVDKAVSLFDLRLTNLEHFHHPHPGDNTQ